MKEKTKVIGFKVTPEMDMILNQAARTIKTSVYDMMENAAASIVKTMDEGHDVDKNLQRTFEAFDRYEGWNVQQSLLDPKHVSDVVQTIYFFTCNGKPKINVCMVEPDTLGFQSTYNVEHMVDELLKVAYPSIRRRIRQYMKDNNLYTYREAFAAMTEDDTDRIHAEIQELFEDNNRSEYGQSCDLIKYVSHRNKNIERFHAQQRVQQDDLFSSLAATEDEVNRESELSVHTMPQSDNEDCSTPHS